MSIKKGLFKRKRSYTHRKDLLRVHSNWNRGSVISEAAKFKAPKWRLLFYFIFASIPNCPWGSWKGVAIPNVCPPLLGAFKTGRLFTTVKNADHDKNEMRISFLFFFISSYTNTYSQDLEFALSILLDVCMVLRIHGNEYWIHNMVVVKNIRWSCCFGKYYSFNLLNWLNINILIYKKN